MIVGDKQREGTPLARTITTHPTSNVRMTERASVICQQLNSYKRANPKSNFEDMRRWYSEKNKCWFSLNNTRRYYYGFHEVNNGQSYSQVRVGAMVTI